VTAKDSNCGDLYTLTAIPGMLNPDSLSAIMKVVDP